ncbi:unnamed protein product [Taenia asiatica]|uniref:Testis-expressed sequence 264 protein n=1 Tax=Taenia asiatica TaxID=60517 RepID=A0A0R3WC82_TAEAS|nr:unnamed protein product [Taenia asiatica]
MLGLLIGFIVLTLLLLICTIALLCYISGIFQSADLSISSDIPYLKDGATFYYKTNIGSYSSLGGLFTEAYSIAPGITQCGVYYDDPGKAAAKDCRSAVGVILTESSGDVAENFEKHGFKKFFIPPIKDALYGSFPHVSFLSIFIGLWKALPLLRKQFIVIFGLIFWSVCRSSSAVNLRISRYTMMQRSITLVFLKIMKLSLFLISPITKTMKLTRFRTWKGSKYLMERKRLNKCRIEYWYPFL